MAKKKALQTALLQGFTELFVLFLLRIKGASQGKPEAWRCTCNEPATSSLSILIPIRKQFSLCFLKKKEIDPGKRNKIIGLGCLAATLIKNML